MIKKSLFIITPLIACLLILAPIEKLSANDAKNLASQDSTEDSSKKLLSLAESLYHEGSFDLAAQTIKIALSQSKTNQNKAKGHLLLGMVYLAQKQTVAAKEEFRESILLDPNKKVTTENYSPEVVSLYNELKAGAQGSLSVQTSPPGAEVYMDGKLLGLTPVDLGHIPTGEHTIKVVKNKYGSEERKIFVHGSERSEFFVDLNAMDKFSPEIVHTPVEVAHQGKNLLVKAKITDDIRVGDVRLNFRRNNANQQYESVAMILKGKDLYQGVVPGDRLFSGGLEYFLTAVDGKGNQAVKGRAERPFRVRVVEHDGEPPRIVHTPLASCSDATGLLVKARVTDNKRLAFAKLFFRQVGDKQYAQTKMVDKKGNYNYTAMVPESFMKTNQLDYYIEAVDRAGNFQYEGSKDNPHRVNIFNVLPYREGYIVDRTQLSYGEWSKDVTVNVGTLKGVRKGQVFTVFYAKDQVKDPETGVVLGVKQTLTGKIKITVPGPSISQARVIKEYDEVMVRKLDSIRFRPGPPAGIRSFSENFQQTTVTWSMSPEPEVKGYLIYKSEQPEGPFIKLKKITNRETVEMVDKGTRKNPLEPHKKYYYKMQAYNAEKELSEFSGISMATVKGGPKPPTFLTASSNEIRQVALQWQISADHETKGYKLFRSDSKTGKYVEIAKIRGGETTNYTDKPDARNNHELEDKKIYWYRMASYNRQEVHGELTAPASAASREKPKPVANLRVDLASIRSVSLSWNLHPDTDVERYRIYRHIKPEGRFILIKEIKDRFETQYTDKDKSGDEITDGATYYYRITAVNVGGSESDFSPPVNATTMGAPAPPTNLKSISGLVKQVKISWTPSKDKNVEGYYVYRGKTANSLARLTKIRDPEVHEYLDEGSFGSYLNDGTVYFFVVKSFNEVDVESPILEIVKAETKRLPIAPQGLAGAQKQPAMTKLRWNPNPEPDIAHYKVFRSTEPDGRFKTLASQKETIYVDTELKNGATYFYRVQAIDKDDLEGFESKPIKVTTKPIPSTPKGVYGTAGAGSITLKWEPNPEPDISHYEIRPYGFFSQGKIGETPKTTFRITGLSSDKQYSYTILAVDKDGLESEPSTTVKVRTFEEE